MKLEKSAGAIIWRRNNDEIEYLLIESQPFKQFKSAWAFPKGHLKENETEQVAAKREVFEEVGLQPLFNYTLNTKFIYQSKNHIKKQVTLFLAQHVEHQSLKLQISEIRQAKWLNFDDSCQLLKQQTYNEFSYKDLLKGLTLFNNVLLQKRN